MKIHTPDYDILYEGGRLADVIIGGHAVEVVPVRRLDVTTGEFGPEPSRREVIDKVAEFIDPEDLADYRLLARSLP